MIASVIPKARLTVAEHIAYQPLSREPDCVSDQPFCRLLKEDGQLWKRIGLVVGPDWKPLPLGWIEDDGLEVAHLLVRNDEGHFLQLQPSQEERAAVNAIEIHLAVNRPDDDHWYARVPVHESVRITPVGKHFIRANCTFAKASIIAVPG